MGLGTHQGRGAASGYNPGVLGDPQALAASLEAAPNIQSQCSGCSWKILGEAAVAHRPECCWSPGRGACGQRLQDYKLLGSRGGAAGHSSVSGEDQSVPGGIRERLAECVLPWGPSLGTRTHPGPVAVQVCLALAADCTLPGAAQGPDPSPLGPVILLWAGVAEWVHEDPRGGALRECVGWGGEDLC